MLSSPRATYYVRPAAGPAAGAREGQEEDLLAEINEIHTVSRGAHGLRRAVPCHAVAASGSAAATVENAEHRHGIRASPVDASDPVPARMEGWLYPATVLESAHPRGRAMHSDHASECASNEFRKEMATLGMRLSMRADQVRDDAAVEDSSARSRRRSVPPRTDTSLARAPPVPGGSSHRCRFGALNGRAET